MPANVHEGVGRPSPLLKRREVSPQRTQNHSRLPAVLHLREPTRSILRQQLFDFFFASPSCHDASVARVRRAVQEGFVGRLQTISASSGLSPLPIVGGDLPLC